MMHAQIIKIGGSLIRTGPWLKLLDTALEQAMKRSVVPIFIMGGGELADVIRRLRADNHFNEKAEHHMSLLAMDQHSIMAQALRPTLQNVQTAAQALTAISAHTPTIVYPFASVIHVQKLDAIPSITSDSLTLWFAHKLCQAASQQGLALNCQVLILKSCAVPSALQTDADALSAQGIVDEAFPRFAQALLGELHAGWSVVNAEEAFLI
jgi:aspartokinase-like uncharacterized kinase